MLEKREFTPAQRQSAMMDGLAVLSSLPAAKEITPVLVQAWQCAFDDAGIRTDEIHAAFQRAFGKSEFFPAPVFVIECARAIRQERFVSQIDTRPGLEAPKSEEPAISREERDAILDRMKPGARALFKSVIEEARQ